MEAKNHLPARVNITLSCVGDDAQVKKELPMRLLVMGEFAKLSRQTSLAKQDRLAVTLANYQQVLAYLNPTVNFSVTHHAHGVEKTLPVQLSFESMQDFKPQAIVRQVPVLQRLSAMRTLLKELRSNVIDNEVFRDKLKSLLKDKKAATLCQKALLEKQS